VEVFWNEDDNFPFFPEEALFLSIDTTLDWGSKEKSEYTKKDDVDENIDWVDTNEEEEKNDDDDDKSINLENTDDEETDDEFMHSDEYVNENEDEEMNVANVAKTRKSDEEIPDTAKEDAEKTKEVKDDNKKAECLPTSSSLSVSPGFGNQFLNLSYDKSIVGNLKDTADAEINSLLDIKIQFEVPLIQFPSMLTVPVLVIPELSSLLPILETITTASPVISIITPVLQQQLTPIPTPLITTEALTFTIAFPETPTITTAAFNVVQSRVANLEKDVTELKQVDHSVKVFTTVRSQVPTVSFDKHPTNQTLYHALIEALTADKEAMDKELQSIEIMSSIPTISYHVAFVFVIDVVYFFSGSDDFRNSRLLLKKYSVAMVRRPRRPFKGRDLSALEPFFKALPLEVSLVVDVSLDDSDSLVLVLSVLCPGRLGRLTIATEYFFNNNLEFLKSSDPEKKYTTSITKTKATWYEIVGIEDMISMLWSSTKVGYDKDAEKRIKHYGPKRQLWYRSQINKFSKHKVYSTQKILSVKYTFKEADFIDLHLNDIEDMLLLTVQHKLFQLADSDIVDFIVALRMFTRSLIIKRRVEDVQLGVESYQKKLNLTKPQKTFPRI
nr:hypothetical protein [Tanacetum cinerariifolium]